MSEQAEITKWSDPRILIADDAPEVIDLLLELLNEESWTVEAAHDGREALEMLEGGSFDIAILDLKMPHLDGIEVLKAVQQKGIQTDVVMLTGFGTIELAVSAMKQGAKDFLTKPARRTELLSLLRDLLHTRYPSRMTLSDRLDLFVRDHASEPLLSIEELCRQFSISSRYVSMLLKRRTGMTFRRRLAYYRVEKAKRLIETTEEPLYRIAEASGFQNYRQLTVAFKNLEGVTPRHYRHL